MKQVMAMLLVCAIAPLSSCSPTASLERKLEGPWQQGSREFVFKGGAMVFRGRSIVFASYQVIDGETIRFVRDSGESRSDWMIKVSFPTSDTMLWRREYSGELRDWWSFERLKT